MGSHNLYTLEFQFNMYSKFSLNEEISTNYCVGVCPNCCVITLALLRSRSPNAGCLWLSAAGGNSFIARLLTLGTCSVPVGSQYGGTLCTAHKVSYFQNDKQTRRHVKSMASIFNKNIFIFTLCFIYLYCAQLSTKST